MANQAEAFKLLAETFSVTATWFQTASELFEKIATGQTISVEDHKRLQIQDVAKKSKGKREKDPNAPKKPMTAYLLFVKEQRDRVHKEQPGMSVVDLTKELAHQWNLLDVKKKEQYVDRAQELRDNYKKVMIEYQRGNSSPESPKKRKTDDEILALETAKLKSEKKLEKKLKKERALSPDRTIAGELTASSKKRKDEKEIEREQSPPRELATPPVNGLEKSDKKKKRSKKDKPLKN